MIPRSSPVRAPSRSRCSLRCLTLPTDHCRKELLTFIHPYYDPAIIAGQGTVALEMLASVPDLDVLIGPIGGGGLISGMADAPDWHNQYVKVRHRSEHLERDGALT